MKMTKLQLLREAGRIIRAHNIPMMHSSSDMALERFLKLPIDKVAQEDRQLIRYIQWEWAFGTSATLEIQGTYPHEVMIVRVTWPSGGGNPLKAAAMADLMSRVTKLAQHIETFFADAGVAGEE